MKNRIKILLLFVVIIFCANSIYSNSYNGFKKSSSIVRIGENYFLFYDENNPNLALRFVTEKNVEEYNNGFVSENDFFNRQLTPKSFNQEIQKNKWLTKDKCEIVQFTLSGKNIGRKISASGRIFRT